MSAARKGVAAPWVAAFALAASVLFYAWTTSTTGYRLELRGAKQDYYNLLVRGFLKGHLYMDAAPDPALLALPPNERPGNAPFMLDASLYRDRYYLYFGVAPAVLAWKWGFYLMPPVLLTDWHNNWHVKLTQLGAIAGFLFLMAGASRLARFNITSNPQPSNPGRPGKKYFVGMPIPAGAGVIAAVVHFEAGVPLESWYTALTWIAMVTTVAYLMVSTWRFYSFKDIDFRSRHPFRLIMLLGALFYGIWSFSGPVLFGVALLYMVSGVFWRLQWIFRRRPDPPPPPYKEASQTS